MTDQQLELIVGSLLHDIGKVLYRTDDGRNHSQSGYDYLKNKIGIDKKEVLDQVRFHHAEYLKNANISESSLAYLTYIADNIASAVDRRKKDESEFGFQKDVPLESIFNILNGNQEKTKYQPQMMDAKGINYPTENAVSYSDGFYSNVKQRITASIEDFQWKPDYINSLLEVMEATLSFIPSSTAKDEIADISLFDHVKMTAAFSSCIYEFLQANEEYNYKDIVFKKANEFYKKQVFLLYSLDVSGIQSFIYTISSKGALKGLRARSFYLELIVEHIIDELLFQLHLSRTNLIYSGGGHAYLLFSNTKHTKDVLIQFEKEINQWFLDTFQTALYVASGWTQCSANDLQNKEKGSYKELFRKVSLQISEKKIHRYSADDIIKLNSNESGNDGRECVICRRTDHLTKDNICEICENLKKTSQAILQGAFFSIRSEKTENALPLPRGRYLVTDQNKDQLKNRIKNDQNYVRSYGKNNYYIRDAVATKLWVGDYVKGDDFKTLGDSAEGWKRLGVLRADIDNLGQAFVQGFENCQTGDRNVTLSRTATFSRKLSLFFKYHINYLLENGKFFLKERKQKQRNAMIVYSGGDDVFVVGSWDDIIGFAVDLHQSLKQFTRNTLSISGGIGIYPVGYPISQMARETGELEDVSKKVEGKNAITLFHERYKFHWDDFMKGVLGEKFQLIEKFFKGMDGEKGKNFLYNMLQLIRGAQEDKLNLARYAYLLSRMEPEPKASLEKKNLYKSFSEQMYQWIKNGADEDIRELELAIYIYVYLIREKGEN